MGVMPQMVALGVVACVGMLLALRWMRGEFARVEGEMRRTRRILDRMQGGPMLNVEYDPETGHYRPSAR